MAYTRRLLALQHLNRASFRWKTGLNRHACRKLRFNSRSQLVSVGSFEVATGEWSVIDWLQAPRVHRFSRRRWQYVQRQKTSQTIDLNILWL